MFEYYEITLQGNEEVTLTYKLKEHRPAQVWAGLMSSATVKNLRPNLNPWQNFDHSIIRQKIDQLESIVDKLNTWLPERDKIKTKWNHLNHQESVNKFHIHFPEHEKNETDLERKEQLSTYNDLIHEIEDLTLKPDEFRPYLLICPDGIQSVPLEIDDYKYFVARRTFGELCLHYCHVGRHPFELYSAKDTTCPIDQIVPQYEIATYHTLRFYTSPLLEHWIKANFKQFYKLSTLKDVIDYDDPKLAFGYISMGKLITELSESDLVDKISKCEKITNWKIY